MTAHHLHLLLNHFPIVGLLVMLAALLIALWNNNKMLLHFSLVGIIALTLMTIPLHETGEAAEDVVEKSTTINERIIEEHEEAAEWATPLMYISGALALIGLFFSLKRDGIPVAIKSVLIIILLMTQVAMIRTGYLGGKIRRPELQNSGNTTGAAEIEEED
jgi:hypothetical protein